MSPDGSKLFVANDSSNTISVISTATNTVTATIPVGQGPDAFGNFISTYGTGIVPHSLLPAISVFPSPNNGKFQISSPKSQISSIAIHNVLGEKVYSLPITDYCSPITIDVSNNSIFPKWRICGGS